MSLDRRQDEADGANVGKIANCIELVPSRGNTAVMPTGTTNRQADHMR
jgi:hypothetical protein